MIRVSRPDLDGGARLRRTYLETPRSVSRSGGVAGVVELGDVGGEGRIIERALVEPPVAAAEATLA